MFARTLGSLPRPCVISCSAQRWPLASHFNRTLAGGMAARRCDADTVYAVHAGAAYFADLA